MNTFQILIVFVIALLGYPIGLLIARATLEELRAGRKWFKLILLASFIGIIVSIIFAKSTTLCFLTAIFVFIFLVALASFIKSKKIRKR
jgi:L-asparagine transporter-like permease